MGTRTSLVAAIAVAVALGAAGRLPDPAPAPATHLAGAQTAVRGEQAARSTEDVRYDDQQLTLLASYPVADGALEGAAAPDRDTALWALVSATLPDAGVAGIRQLNVVTDGRDGTLGMVHRSSVDPHAWVLSLDPSEDDDTLVETLVHEYAHMLTLRPEDLASRAAAKSGCDGERIEIGCALSGSALAAWKDTFWFGVDEPASAEARAFVTTYAATSVHEDLAESFMAWVLDDVKRPSPTVEAKFAFFADRAEFVVARDEIREKLGR